MTNFLNLIFNFWQLLEHFNPSDSKGNYSATFGPLQATLSKLLTYCVLRPTQHPTLSGTGNE